MTKIVKRITSAHTSAKLGAAYGTWANYTRGLVQNGLLVSIASDRMARTLRRIQIGRKAAYFLAWSLSTEESRRADASQVNGAEAMIRTVKKMTSAKLSRAWQSWNTAIGAAYRKDQGARALHRFVQRMRMNTVARGLRTWRLATQEVVQEQALQRLSTAQMVSRCALVCLRMNVILSLCRP